MYVHQNVQFCECGWRNGIKVLRGNGQFFPLDIYTSPLNKQMEIRPKCRTKAPGIFDQIATEVLRQQREWERERVREIEHSAKGRREVEMKTMKNIPNQWEHTNHTVGHILTIQLKLRTKLSIWLSNAAFDWRSTLTFFINENSFVCEMLFIQLYLSIFLSRYLFTFHFQCGSFIYKRIPHKSVYSLRLPAS